MEKIQHLSIHALFPSPLNIFNLIDSESLNAQLILEIDQQRSRDPLGLSKSNWRGWHSSYDFLNSDLQGTTRLRTKIIEALSFCTQQLSPDFSWASSKLQIEGWANVLDQGGIHTPHDHPGWVWSGCYYIAAPSGDSDFSGNIEFLDVRTGIRTLTLDGAPCFDGKFRLAPQAGMLLIFPSYLRHWVYPNESLSPRITLAFNARYLSN